LQLILLSLLTDQSINVANVLIPSVKQEGDMMQKIIWQQCQSTKASFVCFMCTRRHIP